MALVDEGVAGLEREDFALVVIDTYDVVANFGEADSGHQANIARANHRDLYRFGHDIQSTYPLAGVTCSLAEFRLKRKSLSRVTRPQRGAAQATERPWPRVDGGQGRRILGEKGHCGRCRVRVGGWRAGKIPFLAARPVE